MTNLSNMAKYYEGDHCMTSVFSTTLSEIIFYQFLKLPYIFIIYNSIYNFHLFYTFGPYIKTGTQTRIIITQFLYTLRLEMFKNPDPNHNRNHPLPIPLILSGVL